MSKLTIAGLNELRRSTQTAIKEAGQKSGGTILVGMGTCGIAAGARKTTSALLSELSANGVTNVTVKQTGCIGQCHSEPTVEVQVPGMPDIIYGKVDQETAKLIIRKHIIEKGLVNTHVFDKPSPDIITEQYE